LADFAVMSQTLPLDAALEPAALAAQCRALEAECERLRARVAVLESGNPARAQLALLNELLAELHAALPPSPRTRVGKAVHKLRKRRAAGRSHAELAHIAFELTRLAQALVLSSSR